MTQSSKRHAFMGKRTRVLLQLLRATLTFLVVLAVLMPVSFIAITDPEFFGWWRTFAIAFAIGAIGLAAWQLFLAQAAALLITAVLSLDDGDAVVEMMGGSFTLRGTPLSDAAFPVVYRQGKPVRVKGSLLFPQRRFRRAVFVPLDVDRDNSDFGWAAWAVARMFAGNAASHGFLITPDHERYTALLRRLRIERPRQPEQPQSD